MIFKNSICILFLFVVVSCDNVEQKKLRLYQSCLQGFTKNKLLLNIQQRKHSGNTYNVCVDGDTEYVIKRLKNIEVEYVEISGGVSRIVEKYELESKLLNKSVKLYAVLFLKLVDTDKESYQNWAKKPNPSDAVVVALNSQVLSMFVLKEHTSLEQIQVDIGVDLSLVEPIVKKLNHLLVANS